MICNDSVQTSGRAPNSGFSDARATKNNEKKKREVGNKNSSSTVPKFKLALQMMITTLNLN
jgi:hypothetical protein